MPSQHPYLSAPSIAFWSRSVARDFSPARTFAGETPLLRSGDAVASAGSCFAANVVPYLERTGFRYLREEEVHPAFLDIEPETFGYAKFSAAYGNIYTARQLAQLLARATGDFHPAEDRWPTEDGIADPFRPGLRYRPRSGREFDLLRAQHLDRTRRVFTSADVFVFTLGLTEAWLSRDDGAVFPACPGTVAGTFDPARHVFRNFSVSEVAADLVEIVERLRALNPALRIVLTVSPVPLVATATGEHVLTASTYSKSVLRAAAGEIAEHFKHVSYFPAYEIVTGPQAPQTYFEPDRRNVSEAGIRAVMDALLESCHPGTAPEAEASAATPRRADLSRALADAECEEAMTDSRPAPPRRASARLKHWYERMRPGSLKERAEPR